MALIQEGLLFAVIGHSKNITLRTCYVNLLLIIGDVAPGFEPEIVSKTALEASPKFKFIVITFKTFAT